MDDALESRKALLRQTGIYLGRKRWQELISGQYKGGLAELVRATLTLNIHPIWFTVPQVQLDNGLLLAAINENGAWQVDYFPFPQVVYDRSILNNNYKGEGKELKKSLAEQGVTFVNTRSSFSKWTTYKTLTQDGLLSPHMPKTVHFNRTFDLEEMLLAFPKVCVKSCWGSRGKEVLFIEKVGQGFCIKYPNGAVKIFKRFTELTQAIYSFMPNTNSVVQQYINLATWDDRPFDLRVLLQKTSLSWWECTALCLRHALPGQSSTNVSQGGEVKELSPILAELWPSHYEEIIIRTQALCLQTAYKLEEKYGSLGELGMDVGVDTVGKVWLFEVNGKPAKSTVRLLGKDREVQLAYQRPLLYSQMLLEEE